MKIRQFIARHIIGDEPPDAPPSRLDALDNRRICIEDSTAFLRHTFGMSEPMARAEAERQVDALIRSKTEHPTDERKPMDPNTALANLRDALRRIESDPDNERELRSAVEAATALDVWLSKGGFLPTDWQAAGDHNRLIRPFDVLPCEACDTDREVDAIIDGTVIRFRVCGHVQKPLFQLGASYRATRVD